MAENTGNSNRITRKYLDSLLIETRYMNSTNPDPSMELYGKKFASWFVYSLVFCFIAACIDELHQFFVPGRSMQLTDIFIDFIGSISATLIIILFTKTRLSGEDINNE